MSGTIIDLAQAMDRNLVGGKAASLNKLIEAGFSVPKGFVLTPGAISDSQEVLKKYELLDAEYVAVRSSAIGEDGKNAAWAGQLGTFLNVAKKDLLGKIERCRNSDTSERAKSYAKQRGVKAGGVAVIVQEMIQSEIAGVGFSIHPVTTDSSQVIIEAVLGLGEALVSGQVTPDTYIVDKQSGSILEKVVTPQARMLVLDKKGRTVWSDAGNNGNGQKLSDPKIRELSLIIKRLEKNFGYPVDVEWMFYKGKFIPNQCRPITVGV